MNISEFGSAMVGRALSAKLVERRHKAVLGTRDVEALFAHTEAGMGAGCRRLPIGTVIMRPSSWLLR